MKKIEVGDVFQTNEGGSVIVLEYKNWSNVIVQHQDEHSHVAKVKVSQLRLGTIKNPYFLSVYGVGYVGVGPHKTKVDGKSTRTYKKWCGILERCYCHVLQEKKWTYKGCSVDKRWHNFQNFADWFHKQPSWEKKGFDLDKDLLVFGNKVYSPETCSLVPQQVNKLLCDSAKTRGDLPQGVSRNGKRYRSYLNIAGKWKHLGTFDTPEEARYIYEIEKEKQVKVIANEYKSMLHPKVYENLMSWKLTGE